MDSIRRGLGSKSEAYKKYLRTLLRESAVTAARRASSAPPSSGSTDPAMVEHLAAALVARTERGADPEAIRPSPQRALEERDPAVRAATVRALRRTSALENTGDMYERLVRDPSPEVRAEAATNIVEDNLRGVRGLPRPRDGRRGGGRGRLLGPEGDREDAGGILDTGKVSADVGAARSSGCCAASPPRCARRRPLALGGVPAEQMASARQAVLAMYRDERDPGVRKALLQSIAQLGFPARSPSSSGCAAWTPAWRPRSTRGFESLNLDLQEWNLILREKQRLQQVR